jgi:hypothetical protein
LRTRFENIDGKIILIVEQMIWSEEENNMLEIYRRDVTDEVVSLVNEIDDHSYLR